MTKPKFDLRHILAKEMLKDNLKMMAERPNPENIKNLYEKHLYRIVRLELWYFLSEVFWFIKIGIPKDSFQKFPLITAMIKLKKTHLDMAIKIDIPHYELQLYILAENIADTIIKILRKKCYKDFETQIERKNILYYLWNVKFLCGRLLDSH